MTKTNTGLVAYAKAQLGKPYWYATFGNTASLSLLNYKTSQYPAMWNSKRISTAKSKHIGKRVHDCVGLIKGYLWSDTPSSAPVYNAAQDVSANGMYSRCKEKGKINTIPELPGVLVFMDGHVGVYIGNGYVIEARGFEYGVVKTKLKNRPWVNWGKCPFITYGSANPTNETSGSTSASSTTTTNNYFAKCSYTGVSIVDGLKSIKAESSYSYRSKIAKANGISNYSGTAAQNTKMLTLLKSGKLLKP